MEFSEKTALPFIPYGRQSIEATDIASVVQALQSDFLTTGPQVEAFEKEFAALVGAKHAVAVSNATAALHLAMIVAGIGKGDRVVTSPNTFLASANCAAFVGATPDFSDIDPSTYNLCPTALAENWQPDCRAVVAVAFGGQSANMPEIAELARANKAIVIEDGCHGIGGGFSHEGKDYKIGGHPWADMTTFSFHPVKTMTTGEGGMLVTDNPEYAAQARRLRSHGVERNPESFRGLADEGPDDGAPWIYEMHELGFNYRLSDFQCALGRSQLSRLPEFIQRRRKIVNRYKNAFAGLPWITTPQVGPPAEADSVSWHLFTVQIDFNAIGLTRAEAMEQLRQQQIGSQVLYIPVYWQPWYRETFGYMKGKCPRAEHFYARCLSLPLYPGMTDQDVNRVIEAVKGLASK